MTKLIMYGKKDKSYRSFPLNVLRQKTLVKNVFCEPTATKQRGLTMNTKLRKRLEEAAEKWADDYMLEEVQPIAKDSYMSGVNHGYIEAIAQAKEWMKNYFPEELDGKGFEFVKLETILADFEADMNKLWEEQK